MSEHDLDQTSKQESSVARMNPASAGVTTTSPQASMLSLQRTAGNQAVTGLVAQRSAPGPSRREQMWQNMYQAAEAGRYSEAAVILNGFDDNDIPRMVRQLHPRHWEPLRSAAIKAMPGWSDRVVVQIDKVAAEVEEARHSQERANEALARTAVAVAVVRTAVTPTTTTPIDWETGNLRGLGAEDPVLSLYYPGATKLPRGYPGVDYILGGTRTPLTGTWKVTAGKLPLSPESASIQGGTLIQLKTLKSSEAFYLENPKDIYSTLSSQMEKLANAEPGAGRSETIGNEVFRITHSGTADRKIFRIELDQAPTAEQLAQLEKLREAGRSYGQFGKGEEIEVVVNWPGKGAVVRPAVAGVAGLVVAGASIWGRESLRTRQLEEAGYAPTGLAAHQEDSFALRLGAFFRGDSFESSVSGPGAFNVSVWRARVRAKAAAVAPGGTLTVTWQRQNAGGGTSDIPVTYEKQADGTWKARPDLDAPKHFTPPDLNRVLDPKETDTAIINMLSNEA